MKIYFAGSIRGGREYQHFYKEIIRQLADYGQVLTEHIGSDALTSAGESELSDRGIYERDVAWIESADVIVAEVTNPSLGVGYELGKAESLGKKILCLFNTENTNSLSAMVSGNKNFTLKTYRNEGDIEKILKSFFN